MSKNVNLSWEMFREKINIKMQTTRIRSNFAIILEKRKKLLKKRKLLLLHRVRSKLQILLLSRSFSELTISKLDSRNTF